MPKIPLIRAEKLIRIFKRQGFVLNRINGSHHILIHMETQARISIPVHNNRFYNQRRWINHGRIFKAFTKEIMSLRGVMIFS